MGSPTDIHQHLWPEPLLSALGRRSEPPMLVRGAEGWTLRLAGEPEARVDLAGHDPVARAALADADGLERVLVAPSTPLGIEALPAGEAEPLLAAYHEGVARWAGRFAPGPRSASPRPIRRRWPGCSTRGSPGPAWPPTRSAARPATTASARCSRRSSATTRRC